MELRHLTTFIHVCEFMSFSKAAEHLGYTQSSVTQQIQQLEAELGVELFERTGKRFSFALGRLNPPATIFCRLF